MIKSPALFIRNEGGVMNPGDIFSYDEMVMKTEEYERSHLSENTRSTYETMYNLFVKWCQRYNRASMPCCAETIAYYITSLAKNLKFGSIGMSINAIQKYHKDYGVEIIGDKEIYRRVKQGIIRNHPMISSKAKAIRYGDLLEICRNLNTRSIIDMRDRAILTLGFFGGLRRSEIVSLNMYDIQFNDKGMAVTLMSSKGSKVPVTLYISHFNEQSICPVWSMKELFSYLYTDPKTKDTSIFRQYHSGERLSDHAIAVMIKERFGPGFSGHSLRRGLITSLSEKGVNMNDIKKISRHKYLESVSQYIEVVEGYQKSSGSYLENNSY